jgi:hypothetical protein
LSESGDGVDQYSVKATKIAKIEKTKNKSQRADASKLCALGEAGALLTEWRMVFSENVIELDKMRKFALDTNHAMPGTDFVD